ncbi:MAG: CHAD domain-containing protein [Gallionella sp.]
MVVEIELKLRIAPEHLARLKRHSLLKAYQVARPVTRRLYNIYYDTPKLELHKSGMALRLRHAGRKWLQTLKGGGSVRAGLHQRNEWEVPVRGPELDFDFPEAADWKAHFPSSSYKKLQPIFVTDFSRSSRMLNFQGARIELCLDQGEVSAGQHNMPICEIELELKSGDSRQLFELALAILDIVPFELEVVSKAEYGYRQLSGFIGHPVKSVAPHISRTDMLADVLKMLIWSCLQNFQNNLRGAMDGTDTEYLHQMRVALRRLRVILRMTEKVKPDEALAGLYKDISDLCIALGRIREWDVFIAGTLRPMCGRMSGHAGLQALLEASDRRRTVCYGTLHGATRARELQRLLLRFAIWMNGGYWHQADWQKSRAVPAIQKFAAHSLRKLAKRFDRSGRHLDIFDAARLHLLRIAAKKLRYSAESFAGLYNRKSSESFLAALSEVQEMLGQLNDVAVAHRLLDELAGDAALVARQDESVLEAVNVSRGWIAHSLDHQLDVLRKVIRRFKKQDVFWENK